MMVTFAIYVTLEKWQFLQIGIGLSANTILLLFHICILPNHKSKPTDLTICHLAFVHIMKLLSTLFLSPDLFESLSLQDNLKCKSFVYMSRVTRGLSICTTCLLSVLQAVTISLSTSWWGRLKQKCTHHLLLSFIILWFLNLALSSSLLYYTVATNMTQSDLLNFSKYCSIYPMNFIVRGLLFTLTLSRDISFIGVMILSSTQAVMLLCRHRRRTHHLRSISPSAKISPEKQATTTILLLVCFFVAMYCVDFIVSSFSTLLWTYSPALMSVQILVANVYATVTPLVLISSDKRIVNMLQKERKFNISLNVFI